MTDGIPMPDEPADEPAGVQAGRLRAARGIIAARDARIATLEAMVESLAASLASIDGRRIRALALASCAVADTIAAHQAVLAAVRDELGGGR
jgi:hypothetical protein